MDSSGIIQLVIATIFYSTLVAPNIKRMSDIKADIADMKFPLKTDTHYETVSEELGISINKKMKQYGIAYRETQSLLILLYLAMGVAFISQVAPVLYAWSSHQYIKVDNLTSAGITLAIFVLLVVAMRIFITSPERIRTFRWLSSVGVAVTYAHDIFGPSLELNSVGRNMRESNNHVHIKLASKLGLYGYSAILTIEDITGQKVYHAVAGRIQKSRYIKGGSSYYIDGQSKALIDIVYSLSLKPGTYKTRLLVFETIFPGVASPSEILTGLSITPTEAKQSIVDIDLSVESKNYSYKSKDDRPCEVEFTNDLADAEGLRTLLSSPRFQKMFSKTKILFNLGNSNGVLTYDMIERALHPRRIFAKRVALLLGTKSSKKTPHKSIILTLR